MNPSKLVKNQLPPRTRSQSEAQVIHRCSGSLRLCAWRRTLKFCVSRSLRRLIILPLALMFLSCRSPHQNDKSTIHQDRVDKHKIPGLSIAVLAPERLSSAGYGLASVELNVPATAETAIIRPAATVHCDRGMILFEDADRAGYKITRTSRCARTLERIHSAFVLHRGTTVSEGLRFRATTRAERSRSADIRLHVRPREVELHQHGIELVILSSKVTGKFYCEFCKRNLQAAG